jgi:hypothetical protein
MIPEQSIDNLTAEFYHVNAILLQHEKLGMHRQSRRPRRELNFRSLHRKAK